MPSFDVISEADKQAVNDSFNQCLKEIEQRFDFKDAEITAKFTEKDKLFEFKSNSEAKTEAAFDILVLRLSKRGVSPSFLDAQKTEAAGGKFHKKTATLKHGLSKELAKKVSELIKNNKNLKVTTAIQGESVRVSGKKKDELQEVMAVLRTADFPQPLSFNNFRD